MMVDEKSPFHQQPVDGCVGRICLTSLVLNCDRAATPRG